MPICNRCGRFCLDGEGERHCWDCLPEYLAKVEALEDQARKLVQVMEQPLRNPPPWMTVGLIACTMDIGAILKSMDNPGGPHAAE